MPIWQKAVGYGTHAEMPAYGSPGRLYFCTTHSAWYRDSGTAWTTCAATAEAGPHTHDAADVNAGTVATARLGSGTADATTYLRGDQTWATPAGGSGAKATYISLIHHFTTLENTVSANATWKIPAVATYGQAAVRLDMTKLGTPASAELVVCYTNTATTGTNQIGIRLGAAPVAAGTTVTAVASSVATLANSSTYPQTIVKAITVSELGSTAQWVQLALILATGTVGPNIFSADLVLYY